MADIASTGKTLASFEPHPPADAGAREAAMADGPDAVRRLARLLGPGLIADAADDAPASIGTCASLGYGAAGSLIALIVWVYDSAIIVFKAEVTAMFARRDGSGIEADAYAMPTTAHRNAGLQRRQ